MKDFPKKEGRGKEEFDEDYFTKGKYQGKKRTGDPEDEESDEEVDEDDEDSEEQEEEQNEFKVKVRELKE